MSVELYLNELKNKGKIDNFEEKIIKSELEIDKIENQRLICSKYVEEMENSLNKLQKKAIEYPENEDIKEKIKENTKKLKKAQITLNDLNDRISRKEIALLKFNQARREEIRMGLIEYFHESKLKCEKLRQEWINYNELAISVHDELKETEEEIECVKRILKMEFGDSGKYPNK
jgi:chromosome segregation ATPase